MSSHALFVALAAALALALPSPAGAASNVQVTALDCELHPRKIAIKNKGDSPQDLTGWKLMSNKPGEEYELSGVERPGQIGPGETIFVYNGHGSSAPAPYQSGGVWIYLWNYSEVLDESKFVLTLDGTDFIRLVDASGFPWREVHNLTCPDNPGPVPPLQQPETPTPTPSNPDPGAGNNTNPTDGNQATSAQTEANQQAAANQNAAAQNRAAGAGGTTAQTGNVSGQAAGGPQSGAGLLAPSDARFAAPPLALGFLGIVSAIALAVLGLRMIRRTSRRH